MVTFKFSLSKKNDSLLEVNLNIINPPNSFRLFKNNLKITSLQCDCPVNEDNQFFYFYNANERILLSYLVEVGYFSKHGQYGILDNTIFAFAGEEFLLLSTDILNGISKTSIYISFDNLDFNHKLMPLVSNSLTYVSNWGQAYELMKSSFVFCNYKEYFITESFIIYTDSTLETTYINELKSLYNFYSSLFLIKPSINLTFPSLDLPYGLFAGSSRSNLCFTFNPESLRDWQLLSHRLFHAFMDTRLDFSAFHTPPNLWITEGLATYYENKALEVLSSSLKIDLNFSFENELSKLYGIYLYSLNKNNNLFNFPPINEGKLKIKALIEYLHYIKAPLLISLFDLDSKDIFIKYLLTLDNIENFSQPIMLKSLLGEKVNTYLIKYILGTEKIILPLNPPSDFYSNIKDFEFTMASWFNKDDIPYNNSIDIQNLP